jgi:hypothetical protein
MVSTSPGDGSQRGNDLADLIGQGEEGDRQQRQQRGNSAKKK